MKTFPGKKLLFYLVAILSMAALVETASTLLVYHRYHEYVAEALQTRQRWATLLILQKTLSPSAQPTDLSMRSNPRPFRIPDSLHGYRVNNGSYDVTYRSAHFDTIRQFRYHVTVLADGDRYVGDPEGPNGKEVYVFGDSWMFGEGVNDEQTFTYLLQSRFRNTRFHLYANPGPSMSNAYLNVDRLRSHIGPEDILILGYARFHDFRHVAAPSRIRQFGEPKSDSLDPAAFRHVRVRLEGEGFVIDKVPFFCAYMNDYCKQPDPSQGYMDTVTARLVNAIARSTPATVYLLHVDGRMSQGMQNQLDPRVRIMDATATTFDYEYRDDVNGFDPHPGPYWNHAIFRRLSDTLCGRLTWNDR